MASDLGDGRKSQMGSGGELASNLASQEPMATDCLLYLVGALVGAALLDGVRKVTAPIH